MTRKRLRLWPRSLAGQMIALLLLALVAAQALSLAVFLDERRHAVRAADRAQVLSRTVSVVRLLADTPPALSERILAAASGPRLGYWLAGESAVPLDDPMARDNPLQRRLSRELEGAGDVLVRVEEAPSWFKRWRKERKAWRDQHDDHDDDDHDDDDHYDDDERPSWRDYKRWRKYRRGHPLSLTLSIHLPDGRWLNGETLLPSAAFAWAWVTPVTLLGLALAIVAIVIFSVRRITRPMGALAGAAERFGRGAAVEPLAEEGPEDVRHTIRAFNLMRERLERFVADRTRMLAAISHDLRTPITALRLRAEFIEDRETRDKILETLAEMEQMTEAALAFAREDAAREETRLVDLAALIQSLCDDLGDAGHDVTYAGPDKAPVPCRPISLKRALANLIQNAVAYGERARVRLEGDQDALRIIVEDDGPGIPEADLERVFEPFLRLETSRSRETGGVGLGLAIARSILRSHGGDVTLENRPEGGLRATARLPMGQPD
ncbi:MAG: ATP-binding protein [Pseudomonadota bacterium]